MGLAHHVLDETRVFIGLLCDELFVGTFEQRIERAGAALLDVQVLEGAALNLRGVDAGKPQGREMILHKVWDYQFDPGTNLVDVTVRRLRAKVDAGFPVHLLHTVTGIGYMIAEKP